MEIPLELEINWTFVIILMFWGELDITTMVEIYVIILTHKEIVLRPIAKIFTFAYVVGVTILLPG